MQLSSDSTCPLAFLPSPLPRRFVLVVLAVSVVSFSFLPSPISPSLPASFGDARTTSSRGTGAVLVSTTVPTPSSFSLPLLHRATGTPDDDGSRGDRALLTTSSSSSSSFSTVSIPDPSERPVPGGCAPTRVVLVGPSSAAGVVHTLVST